MRDSCRDGRNVSISVKTGGSADAVAGALPEALAQTGGDVRTLLPLYRRLTPLIRGKGAMFECTVFELEAGIGLSRYLRRSTTAASGSVGPVRQDGYPYGIKRRAPFSDNDLRFAVLSVAAKIAVGAIDGWKPISFTRMIGIKASCCVYPPRQRRRCLPSLPFTISRFRIISTGTGGRSRLPPHLQCDCSQYYGDMSFLKGGLTTASAVTTVSPTLRKRNPHTGNGNGNAGRAC